MTFTEQLQRYLRGETVAAISYPPQGTAHFALISFLILLQLFAAALLFAAFARRRLPAGSPLWRLLAFLSRAPGAAVMNVGVVILFFAAWEFALGAYIKAHSPPGGTITRTHPTLLWRYVPGSAFTAKGVEYRINSMGLRDEEIPLGKEPGEFRIVSLGDSWTFGQGVESARTFSKELERLLRARYPGRSIRVINAGTQGYSTMQGYFLLREVGLRYRPDMILVNSFNHTYFREYAFERLRFSASPFLQWLQMRLLALHSYTVLRSELIRFNSLTYLGRPPPSQDPEVTNDEMIIFLQKLIDLARDEGISALFVSQPLKAPGWSHWAAITPQLHYRAAGPGRALFFDLKPPLLIHTPEKFFLKDDPFHCNAAGHLEIARLLCGKIVEERLIEERRAP